MFVKKKKNDSVEILKKINLNKVLLSTRTQAACSNFPATVLFSSENLFILHIIVFLFLFNNLSNYKLTMFKRFILWFTRELSISFYFHIYI